MRYRLLALVLALSAFVPLSRGGPPEGTAATLVRVPGGSESTPGVKSFTQAFVGGQRACVIVIGDHDPVVDVEVKVYDAKNNLVAQDRGTSPAQDYAAVIWYPPRTDTYRIEIGSHGKIENICSVAIK